MNKEDSCHLDILELLDNFLRDITITISIPQGGSCMSSTLDEVKAVIGEVLKIDTKDIKEETRFIEDLKADSMDQFFLIDGFCEKFNMTISDEDARNIKSVGDVVKYVETKKK
jgi:acyl carrier protein